MSFPRAFRRTPVVIPLVLLAGCDLLGPSGAEGPGSLEMELGSFHDLEGAAVFEIVGGKELGEVVCEEGEAFWQHRGDTTDVVILMDEPGTIRFRVATRDVGKRPDVRVVEVAGADNVLRPDVGAYFVNIRRIKGANGGGS